MKHSATVLSARSEFDAFLFAHIGEEKNGMLLSVLSALARLDLDPWREAAELARMPQQTARQRLTSLIVALPNQPPTRPEPETISARLIALLPRAASPSVASSDKLSGAGAALNSRACAQAHDHQPGSGRRRYRWLTNKRLQMRMIRPNRLSPIKSVSASRNNSLKASRRFNRIASPRLDAGRSFATDHRASGSDPPRPKFERRTGRRTLGCRSGGRRPS
jgi:hypothetical protein